MDEQKKENLTLKEILKKEFNIDMPISGGNGNSMDDAIKIDKEHKDWSAVEYSCLKYINQLMNRSWKLKEQSLMEKNGRQYDQMKLKIDGDDNSFYNYYFDITDHI